ncbi:hypothetical protein RM780_05045 [Streptomyces sp. DSM 44917]|uniref:Translation initiation factor IF-2 n=1 Tax=Streptomyces boetiae TaxID=3075541 RepID=A0ABU2L487_9ACTN|nr:hypothetical protein [Streptomyces sp. DSM 44917]MDT0306327.1 hypothetical protein [Streptomyces sp. DSM 44917]
MRTARMAAYFFGGAAALGAAAYLVIYLYRWQWQRALVSGVLLLVIEVLLLGLAALDRISRLERRVREGDRRQEDILAQLRAAEREARRGPRVPGAGPGRQRFAWLSQEESRTFVFVPVLMAAGVALSGLAWVVERVARATVRPAASRRLAGRLAPLAAPPGGLAGGARELPERPALGSVPARRRLLRAGAFGIAALLCVGLYSGLSALTETQPPERGGEAATSLLLSVEGNGITEARAELAAHQLWERCRDSTALPLRDAGMTPLSDGLFAATVSPSLSEHDAHRLRGCLEDTSIDRIRATVLGTGSLTAAG